MLIRSIWLSKVTLQEWLPQHEIRHRKLIPFDQFTSVVLPEYGRLWKRVLHDARGVMAHGGPAAG